MDFFSQPTNLALIATAVGSGLMLLYTGINGRNISQLSPAQATQLINKRAQILDLRSVEQFAAAIGAAVIQTVGAGGAEGAFKAANERAGCFGRKVAAAAFAIGAHFKHQDISA